MLERAIPSLSDTGVPIGRRAAARLRLSIPARMLSVYDTQHCILLDLSQTGARIALAVPLTIGDGGYLKVGHFELFGEVVRCKHGSGGGINGIEFEAPLAHAVVLAVRHYAETFQLRERDALRDQVRRWVTGEK